MKLPTKVKVKLNKFIDEDDLNEIIEENLKDYLKEKYQNDISDIFWKISNLGKVTVSIEIDWYEEE